MMNVIDRDTVMCISLAARPGNHGNRFHNYLYSDLGLNYIYKSFSSSDIRATIAGARSLGIRGISVSMPYKESCIPFLDSIDPSAEAIQSVNTIVNDDGGLTGYNTDYIAVRSLLKGIRSDQDFALRGSGGMAMAALAALAHSGFRDGVVIARSRQRGTSLAERYGMRWAQDLGDARPAFLINATPIGMAGGPEVDELPFPRSAVSSASLVMDAVFRPARTPFVKIAEDGDATVITGDSIMLLQALEQFVLYTGVRPTTEQVRRAEEYALA
jgi:shikimate dehydrogenase